MTTTTDFGAIMSDVENINATRTKAEAAAAAAAAKADAVSQDAEDARASAQAQAQAALNATTNAFTSIMRRLTAEVRDARAVAAKTLIETPDQAFAAWLQYRLLRAANQGTWTVVGGQLSAVTNRQPPPGEWGPPIVGITRADGSSTYHETYDQFVAQVVTEWETKEMQRAMYARSEELAASKTALIGGNK